jgi:hypothetical protein
VKVEVFNVSGHPRAFQCYAWAYQDNDGRTQYTAVLKLPPVKSPQDAVRAALVAQARNEEKKRKAGRPKLPKGQVKNVIAIRLTDAEKREYESRAERAGLRLSDWIRRALDRA